MTGTIAGIDRDRVAGSWKQVRGSVEAFAGRLLGDAKLQADGKARQVEGKVQNLAGSVKDAAQPGG